MRSSYDVVCFVAEVALVVGTEIVKVNEHVDAGTDTAEKVKHFAGEANGD